MKKDSQIADYNEGLFRGAGTRLLIRLVVVLVVLNIVLLLLEGPRHLGFGPNRVAFEALLVTGLMVLVGLHAGLFGSSTVLRRSTRAEPHIEPLSHDVEGKGDARRDSTLRTPFLEPPPERPPDECLEPLAAACRDRPIERSIGLHAEPDDRLGDAPLPARSAKPRRARRVRQRSIDRVATTISVLLVVLIVIAGFDLAARLALGRGLNLWLDWPLAASLWHLARDNLAPPALLLVGIGMPLLLLAVVWGGQRGLAALALAAAELTRSRGPGRALARGFSIAFVAGLGVALVAGGAWGVAVTQNPSWNNVSRSITPAVHLVREQWALAQRTRAEAQVFGRRLQKPDARVARALPGLAGTPLDLWFIESYGVAALQREDYAAVIEPVLDHYDEALRAHGYSVVSGTLDAVTFGGQSWLNHATFLSGHEVSNALRYEMLMRSNASNLVDDLAATGFASAVVMPAIVETWPEGRWFGYDRIHEAADMGYAGPAFHWVTMPDQYTLAFLKRQVHPQLQTLQSDRGDDRRNTLVMAALISSHAPWTPILPLLDWGQISDGREFEPFDGIDDPPEVLWRDHDRVRAYYARSVAYSLKVSFDALIERARSAAHTVSGETADGSPESVESISTIIEESDSIPGATRNASGNAIRGTTEHRGDDSRHAFVVGDVAAPASPPDPAREPVNPPDGLTIVLGDHQAAPLITGPHASPAVPVHLIARDPALLEPFLARGFVPGLRPDVPEQSAPGLAPMQAFRGWLHEDFGARLLDEP